MMIVKTRQATLHDLEQRDVTKAALVMAECPPACMDCAHWLVSGIKSFQNDQRHIIAAMH